ncbi:MAG: alpha-L-fucosidase [Henriciella sp.]|nr:alpha-L-fucosidase [Henriciella sp.]
MPTPYKPTLESLTDHWVPDWFRDAKFGIFIHWGPYSVPAFAPHEKQIDALSEPGPAARFANLPYAEWYMNTMLFEDSPTARFHAETYGADYRYDKFGEAFNASLDNWDPAAWAKTFKRSAARYIVLVAKHHDGFLLWPSDTPNPHKPNWGTTRDVVGELAAAVRAEGLKFGIYYSGGVDWTFKHKRIESFADLFTSMPGDAEGYTEYANAHYRELIARYQPDYLWNDIGYPSDAAAFEVISHYYNAVPHGLTNDRWMSPAGLAAPGAFERPDGVTGLIPPKPPVWDVRTPEYGMFNQILPFVWETTRGMGHSFGYNRNESELDLLSRDQIADMLARAACFNGNVLLNVGPRGDAELDPAQVARLDQVGTWMDTANDAIFDTRPVALSQKTIGDVSIGATERGNRLYVHLFGQPDTEEIKIELASDPQVFETILYQGKTVPNWSQAGAILSVNVPGWSEDPVQILELVRS